MCNQQLPVRAGVGPIPRMEDHKAQYRAAVARDQSEDREPERAMVVAVENPTGVPDGLYWAVYDRTTMVRLSVWYVTQHQARAAATGWEEEFGEDAWLPVTPAGRNRVFETGVYYE